MKRIDVTIIGHTGESLREESVIEDCTHLPKAIMRAIEDFLEAHNGKITLPFDIHVKSSPTTGTY